MPRGRRENVTYYKGELVLGGYVVEELGADFGGGGALEIGEEEPGDVVHGEVVEGDTRDFAVDDLGELGSVSKSLLSGLFRTYIGLLSLLLQVPLYMTLAIHHRLLATPHQEFSNTSNCPRLTGIIHTNTVVQLQGHPAIELHV